MLLVQVTNRDNCLERAIAHPLRTIPAPSHVEIVLGRLGQSPLEFTVNLERDAEGPEAEEVRRIVCARVHARRSRR